MWPAVNIDGYRNLRKYWVAEARALIGVAGGPVQVRNPDAAGIQTENSPFMSSALPVAGFAVVEAADLAPIIQRPTGFPVC
jgi:hypothetical protein